jgi:hypothetical protein
MMSVERDGGTDMLKAVKDSIHRMTSHLQLMSSYLEMGDYKDDVPPASVAYSKALGKTRESIKELHALATSLTGLANVGMTVPEDGAVVVRHGLSVVSHEDVNVDVDSHEVRSVGKVKYAPATGTIIRRRSEDGRSYVVRRRLNLISWNLLKSSPYDRKREEDVGLTERTRYSFAVLVVTDITYALSQRSNVLLNSV